MDTSLVEYLAEVALEDIRRAKHFKQDRSEELLREAGELTNLAAKLLAKGIAEDATGRNPSTKV